MYQRYSASMMNTAPKSELLAAINKFLRSSTEVFTLFISFNSGMLKKVP